jgi:hypothetical protein
MKLSVFLYQIFHTNLLKNARLGDSLSFSTWIIHGLSHNVLVDKTKIKDFPDNIMKTDFMFLTETIGLIKKLIFQVSRHLSLSPQYPYMSNTNANVQWTYEMSIGHMAVHWIQWTTHMSIGHVHVQCPMDILDV